MFGLGISEVMVILFVGLLLFGKNLPSLARSLGRSVAELRQGLNEIQQDLHRP